MKSKNLRVLISMLVIMPVFLFQWTANAQTQNQISHVTRPVMSETEIQTQGKLLRSAIDESYEKLSDEGRVKSVGSGRNLITDVVVKYVPIGIRFDDAERILKAAGFTLGKRGEDFIQKNHYLMRAEIDQYAPTFLGKTSIDVTLEPVDKNDWSIVTAVSAEIIRQLI